MEGEAPAEPPSDYGGCVVKVDCLSVFLEGEAPAEPPSDYGGCVVKVDCLSVFLEGEAPAEPFVARTMHVAVLQDEWLGRRLALQFCLRVARQKPRPPNVCLGSVVGSAGTLPSRGGALPMGF